MIKAVIFDMDGVLIDTVQTGLAVRQEILATYNVNLDSVPDPQGEDHRAASLKTLLASVKRHSGVHIDHNEFAKKSVQRMRQLLQTHQADPALVAFLEDLKQRGVACGVVSSSLRQSIATKLKVLGLERYFSVVVTGNDVQRHKPHPAPYLFALKKLDLPPSACIIFEDSLTGVAAGHAAGFRVIGFTKYNSPQKPLPNTVMTVKSWGDISYDALQRITTPIPLAVGRPAIGAFGTQGWTTLEQLAKVSEKDMLALHGVGPKAVKILRQLFAELSVQSRLS